ncbi:hypothetical protein CC85DRAFT_289371 [Cutaneotrichosporon oleaginosum]|uniref:Uncharacterized protein n=1 Tax=Cutaneotrichosporon oleaginosum TaxID=879819 RepID=A0A0J0XC05_9TREE|nr:uncharacterized protein CC85DRAFT_289371 [Cutaneotrichosporon oleaginosum]KLT38590.1 hypothetical protein CC85DRAFT_289371 [Cutaneotrichosporon oleaginosum]TXT04406.1 hypothetical protein COLE_07225 [Cutaneotrichosporon oleaginosum]
MALDPGIGPDQDRRKRGRGHEPDHAASSRSGSPVDRPPLRTTKSLQPLPAPATPKAGRPQRGLEKRLRRPAPPRPITLDPAPIPPLPAPLLPYLFTCHEIQPFRGPRKLAPEPTFPIAPADSRGRKGDPLMVANGMGIPDERAMTMYWSSDFFRPIDQVDTDEEDDAPVHAYAASDAESGTGMMGTVRDRRSMSVVSERPRSPSVRFSPLASTPVPVAPHTHASPAASQTHATPGASQTPRSAAMLPPVGIEKKGMITLTRHVAVPVPLPSPSPRVTRGCAGSPVTVRPVQLVLREVLNPLQYVRRAMGLEAEEAASVKCDSAKGGVAAEARGKVGAGAADRKNGRRGGRKKKVGGTQRQP